MKKPMYGIIFLICLAIICAGTKCLTQRGVSVKVDPAEQVLNQLELGNQYLGKWQHVAGKDTVDVIEFQRYGNAFVSRGTRIINGKESFFQFLDISFSRRDNQYKGFFLYPSGGYETNIASFTAGNKLAGVYVKDFNEDSLRYRFEDVFTSPDELIRTNFNKNGVKTGEWKWTKIK